MTSEVAPPRAPSDAMPSPVGGGLAPPAEAAPEPHVWVRAGIERDAEAADRVYVEVSVRDNGPGVPAAQRARIFEPFFSTKSRGAGLGLGLTIVHDVIERHGGSVALADGSGPGAEFVVRLPALR